MTEVVVCLKQKLASRIIHDSRWYQYRDYTLAMAPRSGDYVFLPSGAEFMVSHCAIGPPDDDCPITVVLRTDLAGMSPGVDFAAVCRERENQGWERVQ